MRIGGELRILFGTIQAVSYQELVFGAGFESGLYGTSRRRDHSIPERTRLRTSQSEGVNTGSTADGSAAFSVPEMTGLLFSVVIL